MKKRETLGQPRKEARELKDLKKKKTMKKKKKETGRNNKTKRKRTKENPLQRALSPETRKQKNK
jgi:hypothetical protein